MGSSQSPIRGNSLGHQRVVHRVTYIELRFFDSCPNWKVANERLQRALQLEGVETAIAYTKVESPEEAERLDFIGSPTILINGLDPYRPHEAKPGMACRVFATEDGPQGSPTVNELRSLIQMNADATNPSSP